MLTSNHPMKRKRKAKKTAFKKPIGYMQIPLRAIHSMHVQREHRAINTNVPFGDNPPSQIYQVTGSKCTIVVDLDLCGGSETVDFQMPK